MSEMIERVARALALADLDEETRAIVNIEAHMAHVRRHYSELARAAIEAMRPTTKAMRLAMNPANGADYVVGDPDDVWSAAIDAALE